MYQLSLLAINSFGNIFVGASEEGVIKSTDQGNTWTDISGIMWYEYIKGLGVDSKDYLYAGTWGHGIFRTSKTTSVNENTNNSIGTFSLYQNYPNPFNPSTNIKFNLAERGEVSLIIYDLLGRKVKTLFEGNKGVGEYNVEFKPENIASGVYIYQLRTSGSLISKKLVYIK
jgi:hypothetical protein